MAENGVSEMIGIVCDGAGFGSDSHTWGGEILYCTGKEFTRLGHLQEQPMPGGDLAARYPLRMTAAILGTSASSKWLPSKADHFPHGEQEVELLLRQINRGQLPLTTSCGRVLDAVSALLGICHERTYEGEPALKLESVAEDGEDILRLEPKIHGTTIDTTYLVECVFENTRKWPIPDLAFSSEEYLARALAELALDQARKSGVYSIGFTGGVAYNEHITRSIMRTLKKSKLNLIVHQEVPPGDGGISFGQAIGASNALEAEQLTERESL
jgi:hydrogenase maturation protein HypF